MRELLIISFIALFNIGNAQASMFHFDGVLDLYTGSTLTDSADVSGTIMFTGAIFNSELSGTFTGNLFGSPVIGNLTIATFGNLVVPPLAITWSGNNLLGDMISC